jgi:hypothetical protein
MLRTLIWGARDVKRQSPLCDQCGSHSCAKDAQEWGTPGTGCAGEIKRLGKPLKFFITSTSDLSHRRATHPMRQLPLMGK